MSHSPIARQAMINHHSYSAASSQERLQEKSEIQEIIDEVEGVNKRVSDLKRNVMPIIQTYLAQMKKEHH